MQTIDLKRLQDFFPPEDIEWKPITVSKKTNKGLAAAYLTNRAIMDRLDEVCGPENWQNEFRPGPDGGLLCGLSIRVGDTWVTKWDGAENTDIEPVKGGLSSAMRRAAVQWGIGRYLYRLPMQWVPVDERGRFTRPPAIPSDYLPAGSGDGAAAPSDPPRPAAPKSSTAPEPPTAPESSTVSEPAPSPRRRRGSETPPSKKRHRETSADPGDYFMPNL